MHRLPLRALTLPTGAEKGVELEAGLTAVGICAAFTVHFAHHAAQVAQGLGPVT